jgi:hypothetical protein
MTIKTAMSRTQPPSFIKWLVNLYTMIVWRLGSKFACH